jgi:hypothetical protein
VLFEVDVGGMYAIRIAGSEQSLTRLAEKYVAKGYRAQSGDLLGSLRALLRWDAPGDDRDGWYWGNEEDDAAVVRLIDEAVQAGYVEEYSESQPLRNLCLDSLRELDHEAAFGIGRERERILIGICCCELGFGDDDDMAELATLNPTATVNQLRRELLAAEAADRSLIRPR